MSEIDQVAEEYTARYCEALEYFYGPRLMSEGGIEGIKLLLAHHNLNNQHILEIGSGLGGLAHYLTETFNASVIGLSIFVEMDWNLKLAWPL